MHSMDWDDLRYVLAVSRARTLSGAASALHVTHTTVGRRLRACEEALGVRLFDRSPLGLEPTPAGQELIELAERVEGEVQAAQVRVMGRDAELRGSLRVSTVDFLFGLGHAAFASFLDRYPSVEVTFTATMEHVSLRRRDADVVIRLTRSPPESLVGRKVGALSFAAFASPGLVERVGERQPYAAFPWIGTDERLDSRWLQGWMAANAPGARIVARVDHSSMLLRQMVQLGVGVFFLPVLEGQALGLRQLGPVLEDYTSPLWLLTLPELQHVSRVRAFLDHVAEALPPLLAGGKGG